MKGDGAGSAKGRFKYALMAGERSLEGESTTPSKERSDLS